jgi:Fic family protein
VNPRFASTLRATIRGYVKNRPFKLRAGFIMQLHKAAAGIHGWSTTLVPGVYRTGPVGIEQSLHTPPEAAFVADEVQLLCDYVTENWSTKTAVHLASYVLWRMSWIHPFADGNGRTARALCYVLLSIKLDRLLPATIPDQIASDKQVYYAALAKADAAWLSGGTDVSALETILAPCIPPNAPGLLRPRHHRPSRREPEPRNELPPSHP